MNMIHQSILIQDTASNVFTALTAKEDLEGWWGLVNPEADGITTWFGMDREWSVPIVAMEHGTSLTFAFDAHHPYETQRTEPTQITFSIHDQGTACVVTVAQSMFSDDSWSTLIHDGWVYALLSLQTWVERGIPLGAYQDTSRYHTVNKVTPLPKDARWAWSALTNDRQMGSWLEAQVRSDATLGGSFQIAWSQDTIADGTWTLLSEPRNLVCRWWDAVSLADHGDPGVTTFQQWTVVPAIEGCVVMLIEYGHDRQRVDDEWIRRIEDGWDRFLGNLQRLANTPE